jgi:hypothetical protein
MSEHADIVIVHSAEWSYGTLSLWSIALCPSIVRAGHDYVRHEIEKRGAYSLPLARAASS